MKQPITKPTKPADHEGKRVAEKPQIRPTQKQTVRN